MEAFRSRMNQGARPEQSRAFMEMTREIEAAEEHSAADDGAVSKDEKSDLTGRKS